MKNWLVLVLVTAGSMSAAAAAWSEGPSPAESQKMIDNLTDAVKQAAISKLEQLERDLVKKGQSTGAGLEVMKTSQPIALVLKHAEALFGAEGPQKCGLHKLTAVELFHLAGGVGGATEAAREQGRNEGPAVPASPDSSRPTLEDCNWDEPVFVSRLEAWFKAKGQKKSKAKPRAQ